MIYGDDTHQQSIIPWAKNRAIESFPARIDSISGSLAFPAARDGECVAIAVQSPTAREPQHRHRLLSLPPLPRRGNALTGEGGYGYEVSHQGDQWPVCGLFGQKGPQGGKIGFTILRPVERSFSSSF
jgi:hypothetical protein